MRQNRRFIRLNQAGIFQHPVLLATALIVLLGIIGTSTLSHSHATAAIAEIKSGISGYCLDLHNNNIETGSQVDSWTCNDTAAQGWSVQAGRIRHENTYCLSVKNDGVAENDAVVLNICSDAPGQVWLQDKGGFENPHSSLCLSAPAAKIEVQLVLASCKDLSQHQEIWMPQALTSNNGLTSTCQEGSKGDKVACYAEKEWTAWKAERISHETLLNSYTDGAPYEAWCADFVSYVYKEAGYPFTQGETDGWDENNANNVQNMGFTMHSADSYIPKPGDIAYFDYEGGHVEIVVSGGKTPTFIYGNSGTIDPTTGNGEMVANTITNDGSMGHIIYYLSPN